MRSLTTVWPDPTPQQLLAGFTPPPHFANARFENFVPQDDSQRSAVADLQAFVALLNRPDRRRWFSRGTESMVGRYLDGGFGVGKTHLLAAIWHASAVPAAFGTFVGYTNLVGALGFQQVVEALARFRLVCIDEFELDDPGDTVLMSSLCRRLVERGVTLAATSNTLPDRLGEERFAAEDFLREIQGLASHFRVLRIEGADFRLRDRLPQVGARSETEVRTFVESVPGATLDDFDALLAHLAKVHPSRYRLLLTDVPAVGILNAHPLHDQAAALRMVVLVDRMYDLEIPVALHGVDIADLFAAELLSGGYRKKYFRALSRLESLQVSPFQAPER